MRAMQLGLASATGSADLDGRTVGVVGVGKVGGSLARKLSHAGARVFAFDVDGSRLDELVEEGVVEPAPSAEALFARELDVLAPCAAGGAVDEHVGCRVVCGAANNPLASPEVAGAARRARASSTCPTSSPTAAA